MEDEKIKQILSERDKVRAQLEDLRQKEIKLSEEVETDYLNKIINEGWLRDTSWSISKDGYLVSTNFRSHPKFSELDKVFGNSYHSSIHIADGVYMYFDDGQITIHTHSNSDRKETIDKLNIKISSSSIDKLIESKKRIY